MKIENVKVGMRVKVKQCCSNIQARGAVVTVSQVGVTGAIRCTTDDGVQVYLNAESIKPAKPFYDIPEKAWLLREVVVNNDSGTSEIIGKTGYVSGVAYDGDLLVEFPDWDGGHGGECFVKHGWCGKDGDRGYWFLPPDEISFVNEDGSLTPVLEEKA